MRASARGRRLELEQGAVHASLERQERMLRAVFAVVHHHARVQQLGVGARVRLCRSREAGNHQRHVLAEHLLSQRGGGGGCRAREQAHRRRAHGAALARRRERGAHRRAVQRAEQVQLRTRATASTRGVAPAAPHAARREGLQLDLRRRGLDRQPCAHHALGPTHGRRQRPVARAAALRLLAFVLPEDPPPVHLVPHHARVPVLPHLRRPPPARHSHLHAPRRVVVRHQVAHRLQQRPNALAAARVARARARARTRIRRGGRWRARERGKRRGRGRR
mmetsp:Transcript_3851/g.15544  ORF Transcript_3851/g.15544 Transcript_3851/m.15544 type:complete len:277 (+) Transcript_3851:245-1075(+)